MGKTKLDYSVETIASQSVQTAHSAILDYIKKSEQKI